MLQIPYSDIELSLVDFQCENRKKNESWDQIRSVSGFKFGSVAPTSTKTVCEKAIL